MTDIPNQVKWLKVFQNLATDLKAEVALAAASEIIAKQTTAADLKALVTLAGLQGIIPNPITATRINASGSAAGAAVTTLYTVSGATKLYIDAASLSSRESVAAQSYCVLYVLTALDAVVYSIFYHLYDVAGHQFSADRYFPALEVLTTQKVCVYSDHANTDASATIHGWLEDV